MFEKVFAKAVKKNDFIFMEKTSTSNQQPATSNQQPPTTNHQPATSNQHYTEKKVDKKKSVPLLPKTNKYRKVLK